MPAKPPSTPPTMAPTFVVWDVAELSAATAGGTVGAAEEEDVKAAPVVGAPITSSVAVGGKSFDVWEALAAVVLLVWGLLVLVVVAWVVLGLVVVVLVLSVVGLGRLVVEVVVLGRSESESKGSSMVISELPGMTLHPYMT